MRNTIPCILAASIAMALPALHAPADTVTYSYAPIDVNGSPSPIDASGTWQLDGFDQTLGTLEYVWLKITPQLLDRGDVTADSERAGYHNGASVFHHFDVQFTHQDNLITFGHPSWPFYQIARGSGSSEQFYFPADDPSEGGPADFIGPDAINVGYDPSSYDWSMYYDPTYVSFFIPTNPGDPDPDLDLFYVDPNDPSSGDHLVWDWTADIHYAMSSGAGPAEIQVNRWGSGDFTVEVTYGYDPIPEPASLTLLALGGMAALLRRRRG